VATRKRRTPTPCPAPTSSPPHAAFDDLGDAMRLVAWLRDAGRGDVAAAIERAQGEIRLHEEQIALANEYVKALDRLKRVREAVAARRTKRRTRSDEKVASAEAVVNRIDRHLADAGLLDLEQPESHTVLQQSLQLAMAELERLKAYQLCLGEGIPVAPDHLVPFTSRTVLGAYGLNAPRSDPWDQRFFVRLTERLGSAQIRPVTDRHAPAHVADFVRDITAKARVVDDAFEQALQAQEDPNRKPLKPSYLLAAECVYDAAVGYAPTLPRPTVAEASRRGLDRYAEQAIEGLCERSPDAGLKFKEQLIRAALRKENRRMTQFEVLEKAGLAVSGDTKGLLANMVDRKLLDNRKDVRPRGYGLPVWAAEGR